MSEVVVKRVYDPPSKDDGYRILVDRLWPRGLSKEKAKLDLWYRDASPSPELRKWFGHDPVKWKEFVRRYRSEVPDDAIRRLKEIISAHAKVSLLYGARDEEHNQAVALRDLLCK